MKKASFRILTVLAAYTFAVVAILACPPAPVPPPIDAGDSSAEIPDVLAPFIDAALDAGGEDLDGARRKDAGPDVNALACANMASLGCKEGSDPKCAISMARGRTLGFDVSCVAAAKTLVKLRACSTPTVAVKCTGK